jgi:hypothetical protein
MPTEVDVRLQLASSLELLHLSGVKQLIDILPLVSLPWFDDLFLFSAWQKSRAEGRERSFCYSNQVSV